MATLTITRVTHSCVLLDFDGTTILTDPWFTEKPGYRRGEPLGCTVQELPTLAGVIASHAHYDHYDLEAFKAYRDRSVPLLVKRGMGAAARAAGFQNVREMEPWDTATIGPVTITAAPARHVVPEITYVLQGSGLTMFFGGDTLFIPELREVARRFLHVDVALVPINGLRLRPLFNRQVVMNAREAAELCALLRPRVAIPIHYAFRGGPIADRFLLKYEGTAPEFVAAAAQRAPETAVHVLAPGEPLRIQAE